MGFRRIISLLIILALLQSLVVPAIAHAHLCAGTEGVKRALGGSQEMESRHDRASHYHDADHHNAGDHHEHAVEAASHHDHNVVEGPMMPRSLGASYCCDDGIPLPSKGKLDAATMPTASWSSAAIAVLAVIGFAPGPVNGENHALSTYKIESSPPYRANIQRHTYLHTSILLI
jgi:hypothetical protein